MEVMRILETEDSANGCGKGPDTGERVGIRMLPLEAWLLPSPGPQSPAPSLGPSSQGQLHRLMFPGNSLPIDLQLIFSFLSEPLTVLAGKGWRGARAGFNQQLGPH